MTRRIPLPNDSLSMSGALADALLAKGSGDAALMLLYLLRHDGYYDPDECAKKLNWSRARLDSAMLLLRELGIETAEPVPEFQTPVPTPEEAPTYTGGDVDSAVKSGGEFSILYEQVKTIFNTSQIPVRDAQVLLELYEHLGMPVEVLVMLVHHVVDEYQHKYHSTRRFPPMSYVRSTGYRWKKNGIDTLEAADSYLKRMEYYHSREGELLAAVGIVGRSAVNAERKHLEKWLDWHFPPESVAIAAEKTVAQKGSLNWNYCTAILRNWHENGLHTPEEIRLHDVPKRPAKSNPASSTGLVPAQPMTSAQQEANEREREESLRRMQEMLDNWE